MGAGDLRVAQDGVAVLVTKMESRQVKGRARESGFIIGSFVTQNGSWCFKEIKAREGKTREKKAGDREGIRMLIH